MKKCINLTSAMVLSFTIVADAEPPNPPNSETAQTSAQIDIQLTYGMFGPSRPSIFVPGEVIFCKVRFSDVTAAADKSYNYFVRAELIDSYGNSREIAPLQHTSMPQFLGPGTIRAGFAHFLRPEAPIGAYKLRVELYDRIAGTQSEEEIELQVSEPPALAIRNLRFCRDEAGLQIGTGVFASGERAYVHYDIIGKSFAAHRPRVRVTYVFTDEQGNSLSSPVAFDEKSLEVRSPDSEVALKFLLFSLYRPGKFLLCLRADNLDTGDSAVYKLPLIVVEH